MIPTLFELHDTDYEPIASFSLLWRWTSPRHNELPTDILDRIRPIAHAKAAPVNRYALSRVHREWPDLGVRHESVRDMQWIDVSHEDEGVVTDWLLSLPIRVDETVIVSWDERTAVAAPFTLVAEYWSDFFYPGDDAVIVPPSIAWMLVWDHEEHFSFGIASHEPGEETWSLGGTFRDAGAGCSHFARPNAAGSQST
jgi:hypothetical protein